MIEDAAHAALARAEATDRRHGDRRASLPKTACVCGSTSSRVLEGRPGKGRYLRLRKCDGCRQQYLTEEIYLMAAGDRKHIQWCIRQERGA